ncbi:chromatin assembly factor 1 subunit A-B-like [Macrobrachium nipponense]|uniref:chromatin assembly factor 1 subunit A-B-like n=1 Tax=Macrobrachium nipponense TaxID=159736 RepID=UPI0030C7B511
MSDDCVIVGSVEKSPIGSPPLKKLKQSRLPFAPVNNKSPKQNEKSSEKKRKHSGSDSSCATPKTPRSETKDGDIVVVDENHVTEEKGTLGSEKPLGEKTGKEVVSKKRGRPLGAKNRSKDESFTSSQSDSSPAVKKGRKSVSDLDTSLDLGKGSHSEQETEEITENCSSLPENDSAALQSDDRQPQDSVQDKEEKVEEDEEGDEKGKEENESPEKKKQSESVSKSPSKSTDSKNLMSVKDEPSEGKEAKGVVGRKRGRPAGSKNKSADRSFTSPCGGSSPVGKKGRQSVSKLEDSEDSEDLMVQENASQVESNIEETSPVQKKDSEEDRNVSPQKLPESTNCESSEDSIGSVDRSEEKEKVDEPVKGTKASESQTSNIPEAGSCRSDDAGTPNKTESKSLPVEKDKSLDVKTVKEGGKKRGRPAGSKNKSKNESFTSLENDSSPNVKKSRKSMSDLDHSEDTNTSSQTEEKSVDEKIESMEDPIAAGIDAKDEGNPDKASTSSQSVSKTGEKSLTPQGKDAPKRGRGRPFGTTKKAKSQPSLNESICSNPSEDEGNSSLSNTPGSSKKKTPNILALFASASFKKNESSREEKKNAKNQANIEDKDSDKNKDDSNNAEVNTEGKNIVKNDVSQDDHSKSSENKPEDAEEDDESTEAERHEELDESVDALEASASETEKSLNVTLSPGSSSDVGKSPSTLHLLAKVKKLTPKQKERETVKLLKMEEKEKKKQEREKQLQEKIAEKERQKKQKEEEKQKQKEEKEKVKEEIRKKRQEEIDAKKQKKEEELRKKEEERLKKEEERLKKEEEKQKKLEEQQRLEDEKRRQSDKLKNKFASFFVAKKKEAESVTKDSEGPFKDFRVKEDMQLAPVVRNILTEDQITELDNYLYGSCEATSKTYLSLLRSGSYVKQKSVKTCPCKQEPPVDDEDDDDVMVINESDEEDIGNCSAMVQDPAASSHQGKKFKAKFLKFCENQRPAYWGTWSKKSSCVSARRPFAQDAIFDYEYDSDDDWEEEETGESLSDSEGEEKEEKEEGDQYEVDNDFFVPHGYLSDDEGKSDEEEDANSEGPAKLKDADRTRNTEQLKQKQAEFEEEMKQKTKVLKPRLFGCLWMADENNNPAYDQLMKILVPYKAVTLCSQLPIGSRLAGGMPKDCKDTDGDDESMTEGRPGNFKKYAKTFPEEAIPALIKLLHGNRHGKGKLCREFVDYWRKFTHGDLDADSINHTPTETTVSRTVYIAKRKVEAKIQELGSWKRCADEVKSRHVMCWYVSQKKREEYGLGDLSIANSWTYINKMLSDKKEEAESEDETSKVNKMRPITAFTKKIPSTPSSNNTSPSSTPGNTPIHSQMTKSESNLSLSGMSADTPGTSASKSVASSNNTPSSVADNTPSRIQAVSGKKSKKKNLFSTKSQESCTPQKGSIISYFKKNKGNSPQLSKEKYEGSEDIPVTEQNVVVLE